MDLLLISNSTNPGEKYLDYPKHDIKQFLGGQSVKALFIPYAAVTFSYDDYELKVKERFNEIGHDVVSIHNFSDPIKAVEQAQAIVIGGGNTFQLLRGLQNSGIITLIKQRVLNGLPYIGWSAGSNVACPTICTTNDMPIVETNGFKAIDLVPFQINPHYNNYIPEGFGGETRDQRIAEYLVANPEKVVVGLRERTMLLVKGQSVQLLGPLPVKVFKYNTPAIEYTNSDNLSGLLL